MFEGIINLFKNLTPILWVSQILGLIGLAILSISYHFKKEKFYLIAGISTLFFVLESFLAGLYAIGIVCIITMIRFILAYLFVKRGADKLPDLYIYGSLVICAIIITIYMIVSHTFNDWTNYYCLGLAIVYGILVNQKNYYVVKAGAFINELLCLIFYLIQGLPFSIFREIILLTSIIISVITMIIMQKKHLKEYEYFAVIQKEDKNLSVYLPDLSLKVVDVTSLSKGIKQIKNNLKELINQKEGKIPTPSDFKVIKEKYHQAIVIGVKGSVK